MEPENLTLVVGGVYRAKKPKGVGPFPALYNDRQIKYLGLDEVQYDSPSVKTGSRYPKISREKFLNWAGRDVTNSLPEGDWEEYK